MEPRHSLQTSPIGPRPKGQCSVNFGQNKSDAKATPGSRSGGKFDRGSELWRPAHFRFAPKADVRS